MGFYYRKRVNLGGGLGMNLSNSGAGFSFRTKFGTIGNRGYSIRTGIPGLSLRGLGGKNNPLAQIIGIIAIVIMIIPVIWQLFLIMLWPWQLLWYLILAFLDLLLWSGKKTIAFFRQPTLIPKILLFVLILIHSTVK